VLDGCKRIYLAEHRTVFAAEVEALRTGVTSSTSSGTTKKSCKKSSSIQAPPPAFMKYYDSYWLGGKKFDRAHRWAVAFRTTTDPRFLTNNFAEAGHRSMKALTPAFQLGLSELLAFLTTQMQFTHKESLRIIAGRVAPKIPAPLPAATAIRSSVNSIDSIKLVCSGFKSQQQPAIPAVAAIDTAAVPSGKKSKKKKKSSISSPWPPVPSSSLFADLSTTMTRLNEIGLTTIDVPHDGDCAYHCYAQLIGIRDAALMRAVICNHISNNESFFTRLLPERYDGSMLHYLADMRRSGQYG